MDTTHREHWTLGAGRTITTPDGEFYITYGKDRHGNPLFRDFCKLDRHARLIAAAPDLLAALKLLNEVRGMVHFHDGWATLEDGTEIYLGELIERAEGKAKGVQ